MKDYVLKGFLLGLIIACPAGKPLPDCPFNKMRTWTRPEQFEYIADLQLDEAIRIGNQHCECLAERQGDSFV